MKDYKMLTSDNNHYISLIKKYRKNMIIVTYSEVLTELETLNGEKFVTIYNHEKMSSDDMEKIFGW